MNDPASTNPDRIAARFCVMSLYAIGMVPSGYMACVQRMRLRLCQTASAEHRDAHHNAQRCHKRCSARDLPRARVVFPLGGAPLRHHHHKLYKVAAKPPSLFRLSSSVSLG